LIRTTIECKSQQKIIPILKEVETYIKNIETKLSNNSTLNQFNFINILNNKSIVSNDLKATILQIQEQFENKAIEIPKEIKAQIDKIQTQIDFYQLLSYTSSSNHTFLPFSWENLQDADIKFDSTKNENFSCQINLSLKDKGELKVLLQLDQKNNININMGIESSNFKQKLQQNIQKLKLGISKIGLKIESLNIFDIQKKKKYHLRAKSIYK
jgi:hypothetical protein